MSESATTETAPDWVDPGPMDKSIWTKKSPGRVETWIKRVLMTTLVLSPVIVHLSNLWGLPDLGLPPGLEAWQQRTTDDDKNAALLYRIAANALPQHRVPIADLTDWTRVAPEDRAWLAESMRPLMVWREGTKRPDCLSFRDRPDTARLTEPESAVFGRLAILEGLRLENQSRQEDALDWYVSLLRFSRHMSRHTRFNERFRSLGLYQSAALRIRPWADHPNLNVKLLQRALKEILATEPLEASPTESILAEFDQAERSYSTPNRLDTELALDAFNRPGQTVEGWAKSFSNFSRWFQAEPERSRRISRLIMNNWLRAFSSDRFRTRGQQLDYSSVLLFRNDGPDSQPVSPGLLASRLNTSRYAQFLIPNINGFVTTITEDDRNHRELVQRLSEQIFYRLNGRKPVTPDEVNPSELSSLP